VAMNTAQDRYRTPQIKRMRASDTDRDQVVATLSENFQAGRLTSEELDERTGRALAARTMGELDELTADLPAPPPAAQAPPAARRCGLAHLAVMVLVPLLAALAVVILVLNTGTGHHSWAAWLIVPVALLVARRMAGRRCIRRDLGTLRDVGTRLGPGIRNDRTWH
jgi:hypothetical protein